MMKCPGCGNEIPPDAAFCPKCGRIAPGEPPADEPPVEAGTTVAPPPPPMPPGPPMGKPPQLPKAVAPKTNGMAIAALITGICAFTCLPFIGAVLALVFGIIAYRDIKRSKEEQGGSGMAVAGIVLGAAGLLIPIILAAIFIPLGVLYWWPKIEARVNVLDAVDAAEFYYANHDNSYDGMTAAELRDIDSSVDFDDGTGDTPNIVYIEEASGQTASLYCYAKTGEQYTAKAFGDDWHYNFDYTAEEEETLDKVDEWSPFD